MYESFFGFTEQPFLTTPQLRGYFATEQIENALHTIISCVERGAGPALVIAATGSGKTTLVLKLQEHFAPQTPVAVLSGTNCRSPRSLLQNALFAAGLPYVDMDEGQMRLSLTEFFKSRADNGSNTLLLMDDADALSTDLLEELLGFSSLTGQNGWCVPMVLIGSFRLEEALGSPRVASLNQRIAARCYIDSWSRSDVEAYIHSRVETCQTTPQQVFLPDSIGKIYEITAGVPRVVNQLCDHALVMAATKEQRQIDEFSVEEAWADLQRLPLPAAHKDSGKVIASDEFAADSVLGGESIVEFGALDDESPSEMYAEEHVANEHSNSTVASETSEHNTDFVSSDRDLKEEFESDETATNEMDTTNEDLLSSGPMPIQPIQPIGWETDSSFADSTNLNDESGEPSVESYELECHESANNETADVSPTHTALPDALQDNLEAFDTPLEAEPTSYAPIETHEFAHDSTGSTEHVEQAADDYATDDNATGDGAFPITGFAGAAGAALGGIAAAAGMAAGNADANQEYQGLASPNHQGDEATEIEPSYPEQAEAMKLQRSATNKWTETESSLTPPVADIEPNYLPATTAPPQNETLPLHQDPSQIQGPPTNTFGSQPLDPLESSFENETTGDGIHAAEAGQPTAIPSQIAPPTQNILPAASEYESELPPVDQTPNPYETAQATEQNPLYPEQPPQEYEAYENSYTPNAQTPSQDDTFEPTLDEFSADPELEELPEMPSAEYEEESPASSATFPETAPADAPNLTQPSYQQTEPVSSTDFGTTEPATSAPEPASITSAGAGLAALPPLPPPSPVPISVSHTPSEPVSEFNVNPFIEDFEEEVVVLERSANVSSAASAITQSVDTPEGQALSEVLDLMHQQQAVLGMPDSESVPELGIEASGVADEEYQMERLGADSEQQEDAPFEQPEYNDAQFDASRVDDPINEFDELSQPASPENGLGGQTTPDALNDNLNLANENEAGIEHVEPQLELQQPYATPESQQNFESQQSNQPSSYDSPGIAPQTYQSHPELDATAPAYEPTQQVNQPPQLHEQPQVEDFTPTPATLPDISPTTAATEGVAPAAPVPTEATVGFGSMPHPNSASIPYDPTALSAPENTTNELDPASLEQQLLQAYDAPPLGVPRGEVPTLDGSVETGDERSGRFDDLFTKIQDES